MVFVGGPNSAAYARRGAAGGRGAGAAAGGPAGSAYNALREGQAAALAEKAVEGPPQVTQANSYAIVPAFSSSALQLVPSG